MALSLPEFFIICGSLLLIVFLLLEIINWSKTIHSIDSSDNLVVPIFSKAEDGCNHESLIEKKEENCELPLNIVTRLAVVIELSESLKWNGYDVQPIAMTMSNTGDTVVINGFWTRGLIPTICGGPLKSYYNLQSISLRWGPSNQLGSEHSIDNIKYPFEVQMRHVKSTSQCRAIIDEPLEDVSATIVSYLFQIKENDNSQLDPIVMNLCRIQENNSKVYIPPFQLDSVFPLFERKFYSYNDKLKQQFGEVATWIIYPEPLYLSTSQMEKFRNIFKQNLRQMQSLKERDLYYHE